MINYYKSFNSILMWVIGNELNNNYADFPSLFNFINQLSTAGYQADPTRLFTTPLADSNVLYSTISNYTYLPHLDVWSLQIYRGKSFGMLFTDYANVSTKPMFITEYGIDAYDDKAQSENQTTQNSWDVALANEINNNTNICSGGFIFSYSDEWWKAESGEYDANHTNCPASNSSAHLNCGYPSNNFPDKYSNEAWWGLLSAAKNISSGPDILTPRQIFYSIADIYQSEASQFNSTHKNQANTLKNNFTTLIFIVTILGFLLL